MRVNEHNINEKLCNWHLFVCRIMRAARFECRGCEGAEQFNLRWGGLSCL